MKDGNVISTLDLFDKAYVLLVGAQGNAWQLAANELASTQSLLLKNYRIGADGDLIDANNAWHKIYEITVTGAVLVRPDGHVAWRSKEMADDPKEVLCNVFRSTVLLVDPCNTID